MAGFERYIGIDYSGAATPDSRLTGLRVYMAEGDGPAEEVRPHPARPRMNWTRRELYEWLLKQLKKDTPALVGIDHSFSFPDHYFQLHEVPRDWDAFLEDFHRHWPADEEGAVVGELKDKTGLGKERGGDTRWRRESEQRTKAKSVFHFNVTGTVAHSTHAGLPWLLHLRRKLGHRLHFWPFDGWDLPAGVSTVAEVYPSMWRPYFPLVGVSRDQHDAYAVARWLQLVDRQDQLGKFLHPELSAQELATAKYEGWILGLGADAQAMGLSQIGNPFLLPDGQTLGQGGEYVDIAGVRTYYEVHGEGEPLLLLMGGLVTLESLHSLVCGLMPHYRVYLPERRGHGRSSDCPQPHSYPLYAADAAAFMQAMGLERAKLVGWSDGGILALYLARDRPELVERMALIGAGAHVCGYVEEFYNLAKAATWDNLVPEDKALLAAHTPMGPEHLPRLVATVRDMWLTSPNLLAEDLAAIEAPTLVLLGQYDLVRLDHARDMMAALPAGQLAVVPGVTHYGPLERPWLINSILLDFLAARPSLPSPMNQE